MSKLQKMSSATKNIVAGLNKAEKLNGDNYDIWHRKVQYTFIEQKTFETIINTIVEHVAGTTTQHRNDLEAYQAWKRKNSIARITLLSSMVDDLICGFKEYETTQAMWISLKD